MFTNAIKSFPFRKSDKDANDDDNDGVGVESVLFC